MIKFTLEERGLLISAVDEYKRQCASLAEAFESFGMTEAAVERAQVVQELYKLRAKLIEWDMD